MKYIEGELEYYKMLPKKDRIKCIHRRITHEQDKALKEKIERNRALKLERKEKAEEEHKKELMERYGTLTPTFNDLFRYEYRNNIRHIAETNNKFLDKIKPTRNFLGGEMEIPTFEMPKEDSHSDWDGSFTMPTGGTYEASLPQGIEIRFANGTFTSPKAGNYIYEIDGDGNLVYLKLKE